MANKKRYLRRVLNTVIQDDCRNVLRKLPENSISYVIGDPPYALHFMGKAWDRFPTHTGLRKPFAQRSREYEYGKLPFQKWVEEIARECLRVLRPGGYLMLMGGTRTFHRLACGIEDAGFEIRDTFTWHHGQGFNKGSNIGKAIDRKAGKKRRVVKAGKGRKGKGGQITAIFSSNVGINTPEFIAKTGEITEPATELAAKWEGWNTNVKPATEFFVVARKPLTEKTVADNVLKWGCGGINLEGTRIGGHTPDVNVLEKASPHGQAIRPKYKVRKGTGEKLDTHGQGWGFKRASHNEEKQVAQGRLPSNAMLGHTEFCKKVGEKQVGSGKAGALPCNHPQSFGGFQMCKDKIDKINTYGKEIVESWQCHSECPVRVLDEQSGISKPKRGRKGLRGGTLCYGKGTLGSPEKKGTWPSDPGGGASRFFYTAKAAGKEKWFLCKVCDVVQDGGRRKEHRKHEIYCETCEKNGMWKKHRGHKTKPNLLGHPTQKPEKLMQWLIRMHTMKGGIVLDPFLGSGTVAVVARREGMRFIGVDMDATYTRIARTRLEVEQEHTPVVLTHG